ncbi:hypothetical protein HELRODRAFT_127846, partial [Helobdella robusta]|uniref:RING-type domain-containing protein n=1 Tax=Helobdella robusta TaxID=6412 RepID=T1EHI5_HELRO
YSPANSPGNESCPICLEDFRESELLTKVKCGHLHHVECMLEWFFVRVTCPYCRFEI